MYKEIKTATTSSQALVNEIEENGFCLFSEAYTERVGLAKQETKICVYELEGKTYILKYLNDKNVSCKDVTVQPKNQLAKDQFKVAGGPSDNMYFNCYKAEAYSYTDKNFATIEEVKKYLHCENLVFYPNRCGELETKVDKWRITVKMGFMESEGEGYVSMLEESGALEAYYDVV